MNKKGVSAIIASVMIILISVAAVALIWTFVAIFLDDVIEREMRSVELSKEKMDISRTEFFTDGEGHKKVNLTITRGSTGLLEFETELITQTVTVNESVPIDIVLVIDLSGSMNLFDGNPDSRIAKAKEATIEFMDNVFNLNEIAKVGVVGYRGNLVLNPSSDTYTHDISNDMTALSNEVNSWTASGSTYPCLGMKRALELFTEGSNPTREKVMIVLGDGDATNISCKTGGAADLAEDLYQNKNISVSTIGFGPDADAALFQGIASSGGGAYYDSSDTNALITTFTTIVNNINITVSTSKQIPMEGVYLDAIIHTEGDSYVYPIPEQLPGINGAKRFEIPLPAGVSQEDVTLIEISLSNIAQGKIATGRILSTWKPKD